MGTAWKELEERISAAASLRRRAVAVGFLDAAPAEPEKFEGSEPSGCSFWRLAAAGKSFYTVLENHFNRAVGAYTRNIPLSPAREKETEQTLKMMFDLGYVKPEDVAQIPRLAQTPLAIAYAPHTRFVVTLPKAVTGEKEHAVTGRLPDRFCRKGITAG